MKTLFGFLCIIGGAVVFAVDWSNVKHLNLNRRLFPFQEKSYANNVEGRITNGQVAGRYQFLYQAGLFIDFSGGKGFCGGVLVSDQCVATAAHCLADLSGNVTVYLGAWNISNPNEVGQQRLVYNKSSVTVHPDWDSQRIVNDVAVIRLGKSVTDNKYIKPAKLPTGSSSYENEQAIASGFGKTSDSATTITDVLRWMQQPVLSNWQCNLAYLGMITNAHICTSGTGGISTCNGDSGGPLVLKRDRETLIGLVSFGSGLGCEKGFPAAFTRVTTYLSFIKSNCNM